MNCKSFRDLIYLFQADELSERERQACQAHLNTCESCADRLQVEDTLLRVLKTKLPRTPAPPGLETRIRASLRAQAGGAASVPWFRAPWFAATAAAALLMAVLVPSLVGDLNVAPRGPGVPVREEVVVVDRDCDQAGRSVDDQRRCTHPLHINALKLADGSYWTISPDQTDFRYLLLDRGVRGHELVVRGELYRDAEMIRLTEIERLGTRLLKPRPGVHRHSGDEAVASSRLSASL
jgi:anti-sigma factor (TIGR02949 family)